MEKETNASSIIDRRGIYYQAFGLYGGIAGFYDYGPVGLRIRRNIEAQWRSLFVNELGSLEVETTNLMPESVFRASGHLSTFTDPVINCATCNSSYRADKLLEAFYESKGMDKEAAAVKRLSKKEMEAKIAENRIRCERCGGSLAKVEDFNLMFKTHVAHKGGEAIYLRPETAQGIFVDFKSLFRLYGMKLPAIICQVGKVYRNEISPRQQLVRLREIIQMEAEVFFDPEAEETSLGEIETGKILSSEIAFVESGSETAKTRSLADLLALSLIPNRHFAVLLYLEKRLMERLGMPSGAYRFRQIEKEELPHYSRGNVDLEVKTSYGYIEVAGNAYRSDYDLSQHAKVSGNEISVVSGERKLVPHVVEASIGADRLLFSLLDNSVEEGKDRGWEWLRLNERLAPYLYSVFPLQKDGKLIEKAKEIHRILSEKGVPSYYSDSGSIGKRYARSDEIGIPYAITCDYDTLGDNSVTIRNRDDTKQTRKLISEIL